ncbi:MAG TPA: PEP-CTERM sorting domain-containing protein [Candidatus Hydrogenedentes bacterium]|jgi:hypothetical protein|nr:PEP-CTERM sorting domain-containing protein [Candidatus Hydrogenedentota bacterium]HPJ99003.1 PEP-CTERM sorting domain-containing protein [Candidatus Hydrogenedentota bacterium]
MHARMGIAALTIVLAAALPAGAINIPNPTPHAAELSVYEVYNSLYGTSFTSNVDLDVQRVVDLQTFLLPFGSDLYVEARARYASTVSEFGYYTPSGLPAVQTPLFSVTAVGDVSGAGFNAVINTSDPFGFYMDPAGPAFWYSEQALNPFGEDHMVAYSVAGDPSLLLLAWEDLTLPSTQGQLPRPVAGPAPDGDYNDLIVELRLREIVPEPASLLLFGMGIAGMGVVRIRHFFS